MELLTQIVSAVKSVRHDCLISISPNPLNFSRTRYLADWQHWADLGLIDELILQVYRDRLAAFKLDLPNQRLERSVKNSDLDRHFNWIKTSLDRV